ncbi:hypothetical protein K144316041_14320 [Clostridium tetani]|uniref:Sporulation protein YtfJ n=1 Tax=Clostridium tetani TaxID=1513 RepID=A0A4Q0VEY5_CLOTA|nr:spore germination protein GerW family protein [Clostridium tetani]RXI49399.1 hypothetical protein DP130_04920 [Clostridium tetani]BDR67327.1 hypothetical protein K144312032_15550 [Clostridium tetani]BDR72724.1 hypothetical protein K144316041_14320 [Clostridium tetani]BDR81259.1 hypothetical protein K234311028_15050 [Clostridium tetani]BDR89638.1 hypothetical protein N072000002_14390 [Clostridium tetani]
MNLNNIDAFIKEFQNSFNEDIIIGNEIKIGNITLIPLINISFAYGTSERSNKIKKLTQHKGTKNKDEGLCIGSNVFVSGVLIIKDDKVSFISTKEKTPIENITESISNIYSKKA